MQTLNEKLLQEREHVNANINMMKWELEGLETKAKDLRAKISDNIAELQLLEMLIDREDRGRIRSVIEDLETEDMDKTKPINIPKRYLEYDFKFLSRESEKIDLEFVRSLFIAPKTPPPPTTQRVTTNKSLSTQRVTTNKSLSTSPSSPLQYEIEI